jgi:hypothetical protein
VDVFCYTLIGSSGHRKFKAAIFQTPTTLRSSNSAILPCRQLRDLSLDIAEPLWMPWRVQFRTTKDEYMCDTSMVERRPLKEIVYDDNDDNNTTDAIATASPKPRRNAPAMTAMESKNPEIKRQRNVFFEDADIVEFEPTIYTTTVTSGGVPVRGATI